jgi:hypothetical protein
MRFMGRDDKNEDTGCATCFVLLDWVTTLSCAIQSNKTGRLTDNNNKPKRADSPILPGCIRQHLSCRLETISREKAQFPHRIKRYLVLRIYCSLDDSSIIAVHVE